ncbi:DUF58 domain-containing protein [Parashewanella spongiae]|uniref:DUF58 domain-containing protein n=1 Tax=Parashewanella spongiae TaxID=342950 RepID=A0A3A6U171_9GAMM|nr:DUF58 domain-containing protein [Parashewanella spongiae]MCL1076893.1 DUF58 domain-containing protein [Parashewanella spongiae]RJY19143.1 DUF58 domain-containing protein [Parashewanella spongiae]
MTDNQVLPLFADGLTLTEKELLSCQSLARALPESRNRAQAHLAGHRSSNLKGRGMEFAEVRQYQQGDDVRTIDWRVTARTGKTHTKLFVEERERPILIFIDLSHSLYFGSKLLLQSVQAAHVAATLGWNAINHGDRLGALIATENEHVELKPRSRRLGILQLVSSLTKLHKNQLNHIGDEDYQPDHIVKACQRLKRLAKPGSLVWIITDGQNFTPDCLAPLSELQRHCELKSFLVTDPLRTGTAQLPKQFSLPIRQGSHKTLLTRQSYQIWLESEKQKQSVFVSIMNQLNVYPNEIDAGLRLSDQLELLRQ